MPAPSSNDLRKRVIAAYLNGEGSYRQLAARFNVHFNTIKNWTCRLRTKGNLIPFKTGPKVGSVSILKPEHDKIIRKLVEEDSDATLPELASQFKEKTKIEIGASTIGRRVRALKLTRKKKRSERRKKTPKKTEEKQGHSLKR